MLLFEVRQKVVITLSRTAASRLTILAAVLAVTGVALVISDTILLHSASNEPDGPGPSVPATPVPDWYTDFAREANEVVTREAPRYLNAAKKGDPEAQFFMGIVRFVGTQKFPVDYAQAFAWFRKSADGGNALAPVQLGYLYLRGLGVGKDPAQAIKWLQVATARGNPEGAFNLAKIYEFGDDPIPRDPDKALDLFIEAGQGGSYDSAVKLGEIHYYGQLGVERNFRESAKWFERAAETRYFLAYRYLATIYTEENGSAYDPVEGLKWLIVDDATDLMPQYLKERFDRLRETLRPEQIAEAERRADAWLEAHKQ